MLLAIDAGNTNVVFALLEGRNIRARWRIATDPRRTADEYAVWLNQLLMLEGFKITDVHAVIIATVVPRALHNLQVLAEKYFKTTPLVAGQPPVDWGIELDVAEPGSVGADRVVNAIAAHHLLSELRRGGQSADQLPPRRTPLHAGLVGDRTARRRLPAPVRSRNGHRRVKSASCGARLFVIDNCPSSVREQCGLWVIFHKCTSRSAK